MVRGDISASCGPKRCHDERQEKHICALAPITGIGEQDLRTRSSQARSCRTHYVIAVSIPASLSPSAGPTRVLGALRCAGRRHVCAGQRNDKPSLATRAVSLGDTETLVQHPTSMTHATYALEEREYHGDADGLIRISVGLEDYEDLRADFISALDQIRESEAYFRRRSAAA